jgi:hypothetical protein
MPIEGPLRELGIHDVFQLLDLSRKTGVLRVSSELRDDEGVVVFDGGRVVRATIRSRATPMEVVLLNAGRATARDVDAARVQKARSHPECEVVDLLVEMGAISERELERQLRLQIQRVVFELMSWSEGFFSFEDRPRGEMAETRVAVSTESLLMEGARRIDEWSRIAEIVPSVDVVPQLAPVETDRDGAMLDLLPHEWQVLTMIDGVRDLRGIAAALPREEFDVARIAYGLATTGVITVRSPAPSIEAERSAADAYLSAARTLTREGRHADAFEELRRAVQEDPLTPRVHLDFGCAAARIGDLASARASWEHVLRLTPDDGVGARARDALHALDHLTRVLEAHVDD